MDDIQVVEDKSEVKNEIQTQEFDEAQNTEAPPVKVEEEKEEEEQKIFTIVENDPEFPGGMDALYKYLAENIKYPQLARDNGITGKVFVTFVVERDGSIANVKLLRDIGGGCGAEAIRVVKSMPKWNPGKQRGKAVRVQFNLPVNFTLK
jgi:protein TonB